jgi:hypothetical protein
MAVVVALGVIAGGVARPTASGSRSRRLPGVGAILWVLFLVGTLLGYV